MDVYSHTCLAIGGLFFAPLDNTRPSFCCISFVLPILFRNPTRTIPQEAGVVVAPADGRVMDITRMEEPLFMNGEAVRISIF